jgi:hypothetical protein
MGRHLNALLQIDCGSGLDYIWGAMVGLCVICNKSTGNGKVLFLHQKWPCFGY